MKLYIPGKSSGVRKSDPLVMVYPLTSPLLISYANTTMDRKCILQIWQSGNPAMERDP